eukprot:CAMPEP_0197252784 /NCGR_PEP_ID=MMETSP1429-20130617/62656_1 /TAXON_ID=49237 /ORGANISM="Chaetoceros  sp., Strain UNC1202" /LENGTH=50 /DNA_ID=CAMNT_0042715259 /DNA_START=1 /DNA_END=150 /DNA_ORIENTATION=-
MTKSNITILTAVASAAAASAALYLLQQPSPASADTKRPTSNHKKIYLLVG